MGSWVFWTLLSKVRSTALASYTFCLIPIEDSLQAECRLAHHLARHRAKAGSGNFAEQIGKCLHGFIIVPFPTGGVVSAFLYRQVVVFWGAVCSQLLAAMAGLGLQ